MSLQINADKTEFLIINTQKQRETIDNFLLDLSLFSMLHVHFQHEM